MNTNEKYYKLQTYESGLFPTDRSNFTKKLWWVSFLGKIYKFINKHPIAIVTFIFDETGLTPIDRKMGIALKAVDYNWLRTYSKETTLQTDNLEKLDGDRDVVLARNDATGHVDAGADPYVAEQIVKAIPAEDYHSQQALILDTPDDEFYS